jgi:hypothetical protein
MEAIIPDEQYRNRAEELNEGERRKGKDRYDARYFKYDTEGNYYVCPNGKELKFRGTVKLNRNEGNKYESSSSDCKDCPHTDKCIGTNKKKKYRTLFIPVSKYEENLCQAMREKIDTEECKKIYSLRLGLIEPVSADIVYRKGMDRHTLRGKEKVWTQWLLYCVVHNIGKCNTVWK